jgi:hypothetical protein
MKFSLACLGILIALLIATPAIADQVYIVGNPPDPGSGNCFPWGCAYNAEYQQVYGSSDFQGSILIGDLEFYNTQFNSNSTQLPTGNWTITLGTSQIVGVNTITGSFAGNLANSFNVQQVWTGDINQAWVFGNTLHIQLTTPYAYDPANGNLLMDVVGSGVSLPGGSTFFDVNSTAGYFTRVYCNAGVNCGDNGIVDTAGFGLVTGFSSAIPEPGTLLMLGTGLLGAVGVLRRRV